MKHFDMGKNHAALKKLVPEIEESNNQFLRNLILTGSAVMPDGDVVFLEFCDPAEPFPKSPLSGSRLCEVTVKGVSCTKPATRRLPFALIGEPNGDRGLYCCEEHGEMWVKRNNNIGQPLAK